MSRDNAHDPDAPFPWDEALGVLNGNQQFGVFVSTVHTTKTPGEHLERAKMAWGAVGPVPQNGLKWYLDGPNAGWRAKPQPQALS